VNPSFSQTHTFSWFPLSLSLSHSSPSLKIFRSSHPSVISISPQKKFAPSPPSIHPTNSHPPAEHLRPPATIATGSSISGLHPPFSSDDSNDPSTVPPRRAKPVHPAADEPSRITTTTTADDSDDPSTVRSCHFCFDFPSIFSSSYKSGFLSCFWICFFELLDPSPSTSLPTVQIRNLLHILLPKCMLSNTMKYFSVADWVFFFFFHFLLCFRLCLFHSFFGETFQATKRWSSKIQPKPKIRYVQGRLWKQDNFFSLTKGIATLVFNQICSICMSWPSTRTTISFACQCYFFHVFSQTIHWFF
jgi:hypothetical protein